MSVGQPQVPAADRTGRLLLAAAIGSALVVIVVVGFSASPGGTAVLVVAMSLLAVSLVAISRRAAAARAPRLGPWVDIAQAGAAGAAEQSGKDAALRPCPAA